MAGKLPQVDDQGHILQETTGSADFLAAANAVADRGMGQVLSAEEQPIVDDGPPAPPPLVIKFEATIRVADRRVMQVGHTRYAQHDLHPKTGEPLFEAGLGVPDPEIHGDHAVEVISLGTFAQITSLLQQAIGDGGVTLGVDHDTVALVPPSQAWLDAQAAAAAAAGQRVADIALLAASSDEHHQAMARLLGGG